MRRPWTDHEGKNDLFDALVQFEEQRISGVIDQQTIQGGVLIPINLGRNHWTLLHLVYPTANVEEMQIRYFDSLGHDMPVRVQELLHHERLFPGVTVTTMFESPTQKERHTCGLWVVKRRAFCFEEKR